MLDHLMRHLVYPRRLTRRHGGPPPWPHLERSWLETTQGPVEYWFIRSEQGPGQKQRPAVLFAHGNTERIDDWAQALARYNELGVHLVLVEYRGYGRSAGEPSEAVLVDDFLRVARIVRSRPDVDPGRVLFHGRSLGGGVVCSAATRELPAAIILQSTFTSLGALAGRLGAPAWLLPDGFDNLNAVRELHCPCMIFHGDSDALIPVDHGHSLHESGNVTRLRVFPGADHDTPVEREIAYWEDIASLLSALDA